jgi:hypothetical protein
MDRSPEDAVDRLLREALGEPTGAAPIRDLDELFGLLNDAGVTGPWSRGLYTVCDARLIAS